MIKLADLVRKTFTEVQVPERLALITKPIFYYQAMAEGDKDELKERALVLTQNAKAIPNAKFKFTSEEIIGTTHYSVVANAIPSALYFMFDGYAPISMTEFQTKIVKLDKGYTQYLIDKYTNLQEKLGIDIKPRLTDFKAIEAAILKNKAYVEFDELSQLARKNYPKSMLADYHLGQQYEKTGDIKRAIKSYQTAGKI